MDTPLSHHTVSAYDAQLNSLTQAIAHMGELVHDLIVTAQKGLKTRNVNLVDIAVKKDRSINDLEAQIENQATVILALRNPVAVDLRFVTSALKISGTMERMGDLAKNTIKRAVKLGAYAPAPTLKKLNRMATVVLAMVDDAVLAVTQRDSEKALDVWKRDDEVDELYYDIFETMQQDMLADPANIPSCTHMVFVAKNFERIGDYATNLAKTVYYVTSGEQVDKQWLRVKAQESAKT